MALTSVADNKCIIHLILLAQHDVTLRVLLVAYTEIDIFNNGTDFDIAVLTDCGTFKINGVRWKTKRDVVMVFVKKQINRERISM